MEQLKLYTVSDLPNDCRSLTPQHSEELLRLHHDKHHAAYVNGANAILKWMDQAKQVNTDIDPKATFKELTINDAKDLAC